MSKRGNLNIPVIGVAKAGWNLDQLRARAQEAWKSMAASIATAFDKLIACCATSTAIISDPATFQQLRKELGARAASGHLSGHSACSVRTGRRATWEIGLAQRARASSSRSLSATTWLRRGS